MLRGSRPITLLRLMLSMSRWWWDCFLSRAVSTVKIPSRAHIRLESSSNRIDSRFYLRDLIPQHGMGKKDLVGVEFEKGGARLFRSLERLQERGTASYSHSIDWLVTGKEWIFRRRKG